MTAILLGSISTLADTSELQRRAFNDAFAEHGLGWTWDREDYAAMLATSGGQARIAEQAEQRGQDVDAAAVHATKSRLFQQAVAADPPPPRPGVVETIAGARRAGVRVGLVTTTSPANVEALLSAVEGVERSDFDVVVDSSVVSEPKPSPAAYAYALQRLGESAQDCVAVEDNVDGLASAVAAGLVCEAFPNENTAGHDFSAASRSADHLDLADLRSLSAGERA